MERSGFCIKNIVMSVTETAAEVDLDGKHCFSSVKGIVQFANGVGGEGQGRFSQTFWFMFSRLLALVYITECLAPKI